MHVLGVAIGYPFSFGDAMKVNLRIARVIRNYTQWQLALLTGISQTTISLIESGLKTPTPEQAERFNSILEMKVFEFSEFGK